MERLKIAEREIRSHINDRLVNRGCDPKEVSGLAKLREALILIGEAQLAFGQSEANQYKNGSHSLTP